MNMRNRLKIKLLPKELLIRHCIKNYEFCNYELYLTDLLKSANCFCSFDSSLLQYNPYQSDHQCDAYSGEYGLDYKILGTESALQVVNELSPKQELTSDKICVMKAAKGNRGQYATWLFSLCNNTSYEELISIGQNKGITKKQLKEHDLLQVINTVDVDKNIFVLSAEYFVFLPEFAFEDVVNEICIIINEAFSNVFKYRDMHHRVHDTYLGIIYGGYLLIFQWISDAFILLGKQKLYESDYFKKACQFTFPTAMIEMGIIQTNDYTVENGKLGCR